MPDPDLASGRFWHLGSRIKKGEKRGHTGYRQMSEDPGLPASIPSLPGIMSNVTARRRPTQAAEQKPDDSNPSRFLVPRLRRGLVLKKLEMHEEGSPLLRRNLPGR